MHCSDLERYLEAHLDGRLGRNRSAILQRHLTACGTCRQRVEELRRFEQDLHGRFRTMRATDTLWDSLEITLVSAASNKQAPKVDTIVPAGAFVHPPSKIGLAEEQRPFGGPKESNDGRDASIAGASKNSPSRMWWVLGATGLAAAICVVAVAAYQQTADTRFWASVTATEPAAGQRFETNDGIILRSWLDGELGYRLPETPMPDGFELVGGSVVDRDLGKSAVIAYDSDGGPVMLHIRQMMPGISFESLVATFDARGMQTLAWTSDRFEYALFAGPDVKGLDRFRD